MPPRSYATSTKKRKPGKREEEDDDDDDHEEEQYMDEEDETPKTARKKATTTSTKKPKAVEGGAGEKKSSKTAPVATTTTTTTSTKKRTKTINNDQEDNTTTTSGPYTHVHRVLLQMFMQKKVMTAKEAQDVIDKVVSEHVGSKPMTFNDVFATINTQLIPLNLKLSNRLGVEFPSTPMQFALVNTRDDPISKLFTAFDESQLNIFKVALTLICKSPDGFTTLDEVRLEFKTLTGVGKNEKDISDMLEKLSHDKWLLAGERKGFYSIGARSLIELGDTLETLGATEDSELKHVVIKTKHYMNWKYKGQPPSPVTAVSSPPPPPPVPPATT